MTVPTNTTQTYTQTDIFEDLEDLIYNVDPYKTPIFNTAKKREATQTYHEWDIDALAAQNVNNAAVQGDNPTNIALTPTARVGNYTQIPTKTIQMSGTLQAVRAAGNTNTMGYQLAKKSKEIKRDIEGIITNNVARNSGTSTTASITAGLPAWIATNDFYLTSSSGAQPTGFSTIGTENFYNGTTPRTYNGTQSAITEANFKTVLELIYKNSGDSPEYCFLSPLNKQNVSAFTGPSGGTRFTEVEDATLKQKIDVYQSDFGDVKMVPDIFLANPNDVYFINPEYLGVAYLRPFQVIPLAKTGDSDQKEMLAEFALEVMNEHAHGAYYDTVGS